MKGWWETITKTETILTEERVSQECHYQTDIHKLFLRELMSTKKDQKFKYHLGK
jgi:hypothetical protein